VRKSKAIALSLLGLGTAGLAGCGSGKPTEPDRPDPAPAPAQPTAAAADPEQLPFEPDNTWHDANGIPIAEQWTKDTDGNTVPVVYPHDRLGRPWEYDEEGRLTPPPSIYLPATPIIGGFVYVHPVPGLRSAGLATTSRGGFGHIGGRIAVPT
jgi:hypothetical protein